jgi:hypothetical protein
MAELENLIKSTGLTVVNAPAGLRTDLTYVEDNYTHSSGKNVLVRGNSTGKAWDGTFGFHFTITGDFNAYGGIAFKNINVYGKSTEEDAYLVALKKLKSWAKKLLAITIGA